MSASKVSLDNQKQAATASKQWRIMRAQVEKTNVVKKDNQSNLHCFKAVWDTLTDETMELLTKILEDWELADSSTLCRSLQSIITDIRPEDSCMAQKDGALTLGNTDVNTGFFMDFLEIVKVMKEKVNAQERGSYSSEDHQSWDLKIDSICLLIEMGLPALPDLFHVRNEADKNKNSKISSYFEHLKVKDNVRYVSFKTKLDDAIKRSKTSKLQDGTSEDGRLASLKIYEDGLTFRVDLLEQESGEGSTDGLFTGMANVDWILLAVYHFKTAKFTYKETLQVLKGVAGLSMVSPLSKKRAADLHIWAPFKRIATQFSTKNEFYMCPMALTPSRLVNCASLLNKAASDLYILRGNWSLMSIVEYVAIQLKASTPSRRRPVQLPVLSGWCTAFFLQVNQETLQSICVIRRVLCREESQ